MGAKILIIENRIENHIYERIGWAMDMGFKCEPNTHTHTKHQYTLGYCIRCRYINIDKYSSVLYSFITIFEFEFRLRIGFHFNGLHFPLAI